MLSGNQRIIWRRNIAENFNRLSRVHERYRRQTTNDRQTDRRQTDRQTDGRTTTTYSEHEHEFTFAKKLVLSLDHVWRATNVSSRSRLKILKSRLGFVSAGEANVSVSSRSRLGLELLRLVPISAIIRRPDNRLLVSCQCVYFY